MDLLEHIEMLETKIKVYQENNMERLIDNRNIREGNAKLMPLINELVNELVMIRLILDDNLPINISKVKKDVDKLLKKVNKMNLPLDI